MELLWHDYIWHILEDKASSNKSNANYCELYHKAETLQFLKEFGGWTAYYKGNEILIINAYDISINYVHDSEIHDRGYKIIQTMITQELVSNDAYRTINSVEDF